MLYRFLYNVIFGLSSAKSDHKIVLKGIQKFVKILFIRKNVIFPCVSAKFLLPLHANFEIINKNNMAKKDFKKEEQNLENVQEALNTTSAWIEANQNKLTWAITAIVVVVLAVIAINTYVLKPKAQEANNENAKAVVYFTQGNYELALNGDEAECIGFEAIANDYKCSKPGKLAALYAGICGGAEYILVPEVPYDIQKIATEIKIEISVINKL